jgi:hypothetical protein
MDEIKELDNKYSVTKWDDVRRHLNQSQKKELVSIIEYIDKCRQLESKEENNYVVLNLDDEANIDYLISKLVSHTKRLTTPYIPIYCC